MPWRCGNIVVVLYWEVVLLEKVTYFGKIQRYSVGVINKFSNNALIHFFQAEEISGPTMF